MLNVSVRDRRLLLATMLVAVLLGLKQRPILTLLVVLLGLLALYASRRVE